MSDHIDLLANELTVEDIKKYYSEVYEKKRVWALRLPNVSDLWYGQDCNTILRALAKAYLRKAGEDIKEVLELPIKAKTIWQRIHDKKKQGRLNNCTTQSLVC